jgi:predicted transcriptional regulator
MLTSNKIIIWLRDCGVILTNSRLSTRYKARLAENPDLQLAVMQFTSFIQYEAPINVRIRCIIDLITSQPKCKGCFTALKMATSGPRMYTFSEYCGPKCFSNVQDIKNKRELTCLERYDSSCYIASQDGREQRAATNITKYGVTNVFSSPTIRDKIRYTNVSTYGDEHPSRTQKVKDQRLTTIKKMYGSWESFNDRNTKKRKITCMDTYGVDNVFKLDEFQRKASTTMLEKYGVEHPLQHPELHRKFTDTMIERYGCAHALQYNAFADQFKQSMISTYGVSSMLELPEVQQKIKATMMDRYGVEFANQKHYSEVVISLLNDPDWLYNQHNTLHKTLTRIAEDLGIAQSTVGVYFKKYNIEVLTHNTSQGERDMVEYIKSIYSGTVITSDRSTITPLELDILLPDLNIAIEYNGVFWHSELSGKDKKYHINKTNLCATKGIRLIHIMDIEWSQNQNVVKSRLSSLLGVSQTIYARKCEFRSITSKEAVKFFNDSHIQGHAGFSAGYCLVHNNEIIAALTMGKSRFDKSIEWELIRYASKAGTNVVGGASKLFKQFIAINQPQSIITYTDLRWNTGKLYATLGFTKSHTASPNYFYFKREGNIQQLQSRNTYQKHKLASKLELFNPDITEWQNMVANGYDRIWDCGNDVYKWYAVS